MIRHLRALLPENLSAVVVLIMAKPERPLLAAFGFARSLRDRIPVDENGAPIPWLTYCAVALLQERLRDDLSVLEFGSGYSTLFFMKRVRRVVSIEHDHFWSEKLRARASSNVVVLDVSGDEENYSGRVVDAATPFDVILIDGIHRVSCFRRALELASPRAVLILDDSERREYKDIFSLAASHGYRALPLQGHKAGSAGFHTTTFFYRDGNCLGL